MMDNTSTEQSARLFRYYNHYRVVIGLVIVGSLFFNNTYILSTYLNANLFRLAALSYLGINIFSAFLLLAGFSVNKSQLFAALIFDIVILHLLMFSSTGINGGLVNLVIITVAAGNILIQGRLGIFLAALATLGTLFTEIILLLQNKSSGGLLIQAGLLGTAYFITAFLLQNISRRVNQSEQLALQRGQEVQGLEKINHLIIQRMHTGIIVVDNDLRIKIANESAKSLLGRYPLLRLPAPLLERIQQWTIAPGQRTSTFQISESLPQIQANFSHLNQESEGEILIFLEDTRKMTQQAQQLKLASLGRLTASIAHEVRNPLGAISHASQLLRESTNLDSADLKMTDIIERHSIRVNNIIENVLELSRRDQPKYEEIDLNSWLQKIVHSYIESHQPSPQITLKESGAAPVARFDSSQMEQVLINLIENGLRYSAKQSGSEVLHIVSGFSKISQQAYVDIIDWGPGISDEKKSQLFEPFFTTEIKGTGLGLYLSRELCEANQAQLNLHTIPDTNKKRPQGCCFRINFAHYKRII